VSLVVGEIVEGFADVRLGVADGAGDAALAGDELRGRGGSPSLP
jgi:hypothetical protein